MPRLTLVHSRDPEALLTHAAAPFCVRGRPPAPLPLLVARHAGVQDAVYERAMRAGCTGWLGEPVVTFPKLGPLLSGPTAPLSEREREVLLRRVLRSVPLRHLRPGAPGLLDALDSLFGDLCAERITPDSFAAGLNECEGDEWARGRNTDLAALYRAYLDTMQALEPRHGIARSEGRDGFALAAEAVAAGAPHVRRALRLPFGDPDAPRTVSVLGTTDLRRGWGLLLEALRDAPFVDELRVYLLRGDTADEDPLWDTLRGWGGTEHELPCRTHAGTLSQLRDALFRPGTDPFPAAPEVRGLAAPDNAREAEEIARRVKRLLVEDGAAPERIAVVARSGGPAADSVVAALRRHGVPTNTRTRHPLPEVRAVAALLRVFRTAGDGWTRRALLELACSPYFRTGLEAAPIAAAGTRARPASLDAWSELLAGEGEVPEWFGRFAETAQELSVSRPVPAWIEFALRCLGIRGEPGLWGLAEQVWSAEADSAVPAAADAARLDTAAIDEAIRLLREWHRALALDPQANAVLTPASWHTELARVLADGSVQLRRGPRGGVEVLDALSAVGRPWDHIFLIGMQAGAFPAEPPRHALFDDGEREALWRAGLPLEPGAVWLAREASLFRALVAAPERSLHLSYAYADERGGPQLPSAYLDEVAERFVVGDGAEWIQRWPGSRLLPEALNEVWCMEDLSLFAASAWGGAGSLRQQARTALAHLAHTPEGREALGRWLHAGSRVQARVDLRGEPIQPRREGARPWNGQITDPELRAHLQARFGDAVWSVNRLEKYGFCPWSFFAEHVLKLQGWDEPDDDIDPAGKGQQLHACLEQIHSLLRDEFGDAALDPEICWDRVREHLDAVIPAVLDAHTGWPGARELRRARELELRRTLERYIRWEMEENVKQTRAAVPRRRPLHIEYKFGMDEQPPVVLRSGGRELRLRGKIDRVDVLTEPAVAGWRYLVDHKTSGSGLDPVGQYEEGAILQLALYTKAVEQLEPEAGMWGAAYHIIKDGSRKAALHPRSLTKKGITDDGKMQSLAADRINAALEHALDHVDAIQEGAFPARIPTCSKGCPLYCTYAGICREYQSARDGK